MQGTNTHKKIKTIILIYFNLCLNIVRFGIRKITESQNVFAGGLMGFELHPKVLHVLSMGKDEEPQNDPKSSVKTAPLEINS